MKKLQQIITLRAILAAVFLILLGCEATNQSNVSNPSSGYTQLDLSNQKDKAFHAALEKNLKPLGSLMTVYADSEELKL